VADLLFVAILIAFFAICVAFIHACDRMIRTDDAVAHEQESDTEQVAA
jgi:hypothetical protein